MRAGTSTIVVLTSLAGTVGCIPHVARPPPLAAVARPGFVSGSVAALAAPATPGPQTSPTATLRLRNFGIAGEGLREDDDRDIAELQHRLMDFIAARTKPAVVNRELAGDASDASAILLDVDLSLSRRTHRTWVLDLVTAGIFAPWWGEVEVKIRVSIVSPGWPVSLFEQTTTKRFRTFWFGPYRRRYVEAAYTAAYTELFNATAAHLAAILPALALAQADSAPPPLPPAQARAAVLPAHSVGEPTGGDEPVATSADASTAATETTAHGDDIAALVGEADTPGAASAGDARPWAAANGPNEPTPEAAETPLPAPMGFHIMRERLGSATPGTAGAVLEALGGLQASFLYGTARVSSEVRDESGRSIEVAAGKAKQWGWGIALYGIPRTTGFFVSPSVGYLMQQIELADFRRTLPEAATTQGTNIDATCSNPTTGALLDCSAPNVYKLSLTSGYGGARAGYDLVAGSSSVVLLASASLGANLLEYRSVTAQIAHSRATRNGWDLMSSGAAGASLGLEFPRLHTSLQVAGDYEIYRSFTFDHPLQFEGEVVYNQNKQQYERPLREVSAASLTAWTLRCALAIIF